MGVSREAGVDGGSGVIGGGDCRELTVWEQTMGWRVMQIVSLTCTLDDDGNNEAINTEHTSHDHGNDISHHQLGVHDTHGRNTNTRLSGSVRSTDIYQNISWLVMKIQMRKNNNFSHLRSTKRRWLPWIQRKGPRWDRFRKWYQPLCWEC